MLLKGLKVENFKNLETISIHTDARITGFTGPNGAGKTNLLDAIHYLAFGKSCLNHPDTQNTGQNGNYFAIEGQFKNHNNENTTLRCAYAGTKKKVLKKNDVAYDRIADHIGFLPLIMLIPADLTVITGNREERRRFLDNAISQVNPTYLKTLIQYNRTLEQRNISLKQMQDYKHPERGLIETYDHQLNRHATFIHRERIKFLEELLPVFMVNYNEISGLAEDVSITYQSQLNDSNMLSLLENNFQHDLYLRRTTCGTHRDELDFQISGMPLKKFGSQGQQKTFLFALKLSLNDIITTCKGFPPLLLLDDIGDRLDESRLGKLIELINTGRFGQSFITDTSSDRIKNLFHKHSDTLNIIRINNGSTCN